MTSAYEYAPRAPDASSRDSRASASHYALGLSNQTHKANPLPTQATGLAVAGPSTPSSSPHLNRLLVLPVRPWMLKQAPRLWVRQERLRLSRAPVRTRMSQCRRRPVASAVPSSHRTFRVVFVHSVVSQSILHSRFIACVFTALSTDTTVRVRLVLERALAQPLPLALSSRCCSPRFGLSAVPCYQSDRTLTERLPQSCNGTRCVFAARRQREKLAFHVTAICILGLTARALQRLTCLPSDPESVKMLQLCSCSCQTPLPFRPLHRPLSHQRRLRFVRRPRSSPCCTHASLFWCTLLAGTWLQPVMAASRPIVYLPHIPTVTPPTPLSQLVDVDRLKSMIQWLKEQNSLGTHIGIRTVISFVQGIAKEGRIADVQLPGRGFVESAHASREVFQAQSVPDNPKECLVFIGWTPPSAGKASFLSPDDASFSGQFLTPLAKAVSEATGISVRALVRRRLPLARCPTRT